MKNAQGHGRNSVFEPNAESWLSLLGSAFVPITETGCWVWMLACSSGGYGQTCLNGRTVYAHRVSYELLRGPIPPGLQIDHLCRVRCCVNPDHMEVVTNRENGLRGFGVGSVNAKKTHCPKGHPLSGDNLIVRSDQSRRCRECTRDQKHRAYLIRKQKSRT